MALCLTFLIQKSSISAPVEEAVNASSWAHQVALIQDHTRCTVIKETMAGVKRMLAHRTQKKEPITPGILKDLRQVCLS